MDAAGLSFTLVRNSIYLKSEKCKPEGTFQKGRGLTPRCTTLGNAKERTTPYVGLVVAAVEYCSLNINNGMS